MQFGRSDVLLVHRCTDLLGVALAPISLLRVHYFDPFTCTDPCRIVRLAQFWRRRYQ
jgi:hypothetical protein